MNASYTYTCMFLSYKRSKPCLMFTTRVLALCVGHKPIGSVPLTNIYWHA